MAVRTLLESPTARKLAVLAREHQAELLQEVMQIAAIPAPTGEEGERAEHVASRMRLVGLSDVQVDSVGNAIGFLPGSGEGPRLLVAAHLDTVFPKTVDVRPRLEGDLLHGPGVGDNSASIAVMLWAAKLLQAAEVKLSGTVIFAATVGEEGLGNLRGMRAVFDRFGDQVDYCLPLDGSLGGMVCQSVASRRFKLVVQTGGGHSWGSFGVPSAVHSIARMITGITSIRVPTHPRTTFNVGTISGGTSVNTVASAAEAVIDLRSLDMQELQRLEDKVRAVCQEVGRHDSVQWELQLLGERPGGSIAEDHPLCLLVRAVHSELGLTTRVYASSTDGNIPLSRGIPAATVGVTLGGNGHRLDEYIHTAPLGLGLAQVMLLLYTAQQLPSPGLQAVR